MTMKLPKKLIEVSLPLNAINAACEREKSIRHGHISTLHLWWARRPLAAARAVIFSQLVNDPESVWRLQNPGQEPIRQQKSAFTQRRKYLFDLIEQIVNWDNTTDVALFKKAHGEIKKSWKEVCELNADHPEAETLFNPEQMPGLHDPFAGGGAIPLEAQRLGLKAYASDLNPIPVIINKATIEIPPRFRGKKPVFPTQTDKAGQLSLDVEEDWSGSKGLAEDVKSYAEWMNEEALKTIGSYYPDVTITEEMVKERPDLAEYKGQSLKVIAWIWARTVKSPNPVYNHVDVPLASTYVLSSREGKEAWIEPVIEKDTYSFKVHSGVYSDDAKSGTSAGTRKAFKCIFSDVPIGYEYIRQQGQDGNMGERLLAVIAEGNSGRIYLSPDVFDESILSSVSPSWSPRIRIPNNPRDFKTPNYGLLYFSDLFTKRQLLALGTFSDLVGLAADKAKQDAIAVGWKDDGVPLAEGGKGATAYGQAIAVYLSILIDRCADRWSNICIWDKSRESIAHVFGRHAIPMSWDYVEANPFSTSSSNWIGTINWVYKVLLNAAVLGKGDVSQQDAQTQVISNGNFVSTDPPYYDNIGYADLSDFFYVWSRRSLRHIYPSLFATMATPKAEELVATPYRHGTKEQAEQFFLTGMTAAMGRLAVQAHPSAPVTIYYAFKSTELKEEGVSSTGWSTFLEAVIQSGFSITGTWPMRTELANRMIAKGNNALASSIVLVCNKRPENAPVISRHKFIRELNKVLPSALDDMTKGAGEDQDAVAPVDLSQAIIGPGMAIFSKYSAVLEANGEPMPVKTALQLINRFLAEDDFDADTQFSLAWFDQCGWSAGPYGDADTLARAKGASIPRAQQQGVLLSGQGQVQLQKPVAYNLEDKPDASWSIWKSLHQLIRVLLQSGESSTSQLLKEFMSQTEAIRQLAYRLYTICERKGWTEDARGYNELVTSWTSIETKAIQIKEESKPQQLTLFGGEDQ